MSGGHRMWSGWSSWVSRGGVVLSRCVSVRIRWCSGGRWRRFWCGRLGGRRPGSAGFADTGGSVHEANVDALAAVGVTKGCATEPLRFCPDRAVTRGQMASFLARALGLVDVDPFEVLARVDGAVLSVGSNVGFDADDVEMRMVDGFVEASDGVVPGVAVELTSDVEFDGSFLLTLDVPPSPSDDAIPFVVHQGDDGVVDVRVGLWDEEAGTVTVAVDEFSRWQLVLGCAVSPLILCPPVRDWFTDMVDDAVDGLTGRTDPPDPCDKRVAWDGEDRAWLDSDLHAVHECVSRSSPGGSGVKMQLKSNRRYIQLVTAPADARQVAVGLLGDWADDIADLVGKIEPVKENSYALLGDTGASYVVDARSVDRSDRVYAYPAYSLDVISFFWVLLLDGFQSILKDVVGPIAVEIGKCVVGSPGANAEGFDRFKDALNCMAKNLTIDVIKTKYGPALAKAMAKLLPKGLSKAAKKLSTGPWADIGISLYDAVNDRLNPGSLTLKIPSTTNTPSADESAYTMVSTNTWHSCGIRSDQTVVCWGRNSPYDLGQADAPAGKFTSVSAGWDHSCGLRTDGTITCWGDSRNGETNPPSGKFTAVSAGESHSCGLRTDGTITCWGYNPVDGWADPPGGKFTAIDSFHRHSCGLRTDGTIACWGSNHHGQADPPDGEFIAVSTGAAYSCGLRTDGTITCWGTNEDSRTDPPDGEFTAIDAGARHSCGLRTNGTIACAGEANEGGFGERDAPDGKFTAVSVGNSYSCGIRASQTLTCWGYNEHGQANPPKG